MLVDDSVDDVFLLTRSLQRAGVRNPVQIARDGDEAIRLLAKARAATAFEPPIAILTDLNMPKRDGFFLLEWLKHQPTFAHVLTVVVSTSDHPEDVRRAFARGCHGYVRKYPTVEECAGIFAAAEAMANGLPAPVLPGLAPGRHWV